MRASGRGRNAARRRAVVRLHYTASYRIGGSERLRKQAWHQAQDEQPREESRILDCRLRIESHFAQILNDNPQFAIENGLSLPHFAAPSRNPFKVP
jgi:hypothetical protein